MNYNSFLPDRRQNNSLNSTIVQQENLNGARNLTQQDIQTPSHFINEEIVETIVTTHNKIFYQYIQNLTMPKPKKPRLPQVTLQSTVKPSVAPKYSHMDYQTYRPMTKPLKTRKTFTKINFADDNYNYVNPSQTTHPFRIITQNHLFSQKSIFLNTSANSVVSMTTHIPYRIGAKITHFSNKREINNKHPIIQTFYHQMMTNIINQIFSHHIHKNIVYKNLDNIKHLKT